VSLKVTFFVETFVSSVHSMMVVRTRGSITRSVGIIWYGMKLMQHV